MPSSKIGMHVRQATLAERSHGRATTTYYAHRKRPDHSGVIRRWFSDQWRAVGGMDVHRSIQLPGLPSGDQREVAREEFARTSLGGTRFERARHDVRLAMGPRRSERMRERSLALRGVAGGGIAAGLLLYGALLDVLPAPWCLVALMCLFVGVLAGWQLDHLH
ncbi:hypothetical protein [Streptomyces sp. NPDC003077]|uniref:hypothetical protein n=1 Tax=Streptomyces sp. NPDC003077 TaxID=3154443 RepID=UPI0033B480E2